MAACGDGLQDRTAQRRRKQQQLPPLQHRDGLKARKVCRAARVGDLPVASLQKRPAQCRNEQPAARAALALRPKKGAAHGGVLPLEHIEVIQQPLTGCRDARCTLIAPLQQGVALRAALKAMFERLRLAVPVVRALGPERARAGGGIVKKPFVLDIRYQIDAVHAFLRSVLLLRQFDIRTPKACAAGVKRFYNAIFLAAGAATEKYGIYSCGNDSYSQKTLRRFFAA